MTDALPIVPRFGSFADDLLLGNVAAADWMAGNGGNDTIIGLAGNDRLNGNSGADILTGDDGNDRLMGGTGDDTLFGGAGDDRLSGDQGRDRLIGGSGHDTFNFITRFGADMVADFDPAQDTIQFTRKAFANFAAVQAGWAQDGEDVVIRNPSGNTLRLENTQLAELSAADFLFV